jgi:hypothetical protein
MHVTVAQGFPGNVSEVNRLAVANSIARVVEALIPGDPPMGGRPIEVYFGSTPRVLWSDADFAGGVYRIEISAEGTYFQKFAYQLGHELGHVKIGPARSNHLLEVFAEMVSLATVSRLGGVWREREPYRDKNIDWSKLARTRPYVTNAAEIAARNLPSSIREGFNEANADERINRLASIRPQVEGLAIDDKLSRAFQQVSAHLILEAQKHRWANLLGIGLQTDPPPAATPKYMDSLPLHVDAIPSWVPGHLR